ncbi:MAG: hypothetical protein DDT38_00087 [Firmicutes bacterium]|nr:hypothetical protein [candidate division NPL-UPA2 bacterium]
MLETRLGRALVIVADSIGTTISATARLASSEKLTVSASSRNIRPVIPPTKAIGKKTATVVSVDAVIAMATSSVP